MGDGCEKPKRRRLQFSLRTLLLLMLLVGIPLAMKINQARKQQAVVQWVSELGGHVQYSHEVDNPSGTVARPPAPSWLIEFFGMDLFDQIVLVDLHHREVKDLTPLREMTQLRSLDLRFTPVPDLIPIAPLTHLHSLVLEGTEVVDLSPLAGMKQLRRLNVDHTQVADLTPLNGSTQLMKFYGRRTRISDLSPLALSVNMRGMDLTQTPVDDITALSGMTKLRKLELRATRVADLSPLSGKTWLSHLDLFDTPAIDLSPLAQANGLLIEFGGIALNDLASADGLENVNFAVYKHPTEKIPQALEPHLPRVRILKIDEPPHLRRLKQL